MITAIVIGAAVLGILGGWLLEWEAKQRTPYKEKEEVHCCSFCGSLNCVCKPEPKMPPHGTTPTVPRSQALHKFRVLLQTGTLSLRRGNKSNKP